MNALSATDERMLADWFSDGIGLWALAEKYDLRLMQLEAWFTRPEIQDAIARLKRMYTVRRECTTLATADMAVNTLYAMMYAEGATPEVRRRCASQLLKTAAPSARRRSVTKPSPAVAERPPDPMTTPPPVALNPFAQNPREFPPPADPRSPASLAQRATAALTLAGAS